LLAAYTGTSDNWAGEGFDLDSIAAVVLGGSGNRGWDWNCIRYGFWCAYNDNSCQYIFTGEPAHSEPDACEGYRRHRRGMD